MLSFPITKGNPRGHTLLNKPTINSFLWDLECNCGLSSREIRLGFPSCTDKWQSSKKGILFPFYASWAQSDSHFLTLVIHGHLFLHCKNRHTPKECECVSLPFYEKRILDPSLLIFFQLLLYIRTGITPLPTYSNKQPLCGLCFLFFHRPGLSLIQAAMFQLGSRDAVN